jgi:2'-5' RNA ligase
VAQALEFFFDDDADAAVRALWQQLERAKVPSLASRSHRRHQPHVTFAIASSIPAKARQALAGQLALLSLPALWLYTLGTFPTKENALFLGAVTDAELLAVHSAVHDVLAGKVRDPWAYYLPGAWVPHCSLAQDLDAQQLAAGFAALHPAQPVRATISRVGVTDTRTGETELLW